MKNLKKFKESVNDQWSIERIENLYNNLYDMKELIINFLSDSFKMKFKYESHNYNIDTFIYDVDDELLYVEFKHCSSGIDDAYSYEFVDEELHELISYMNDPDLYLKSKKYNL